MRKFFNLPGSGALCVILGLISGYPVGARVAADLYENGECTRVEAARMLAFCNNPGPLFVLGTIGAGMFKSRNIGILLYTSVVISALATGLIFRFYGHKNLENTRLLGQSKTAAESAKSIALVVANSVETMLNICGFIMIFYVFTRFLPKICSINFSKLMKKSVLHDFFLKLKK
jgi:sporulation integral membrane protein YlbJ